MRSWTTRSLTTSMGLLAVLVLVPSRWSDATATGSTQPTSTQSAQLSSRPADWPMFRGNPQLTGVATSTLPADLKVRWKFEAHDAVVSSAAIVAGVVYVGCDKGIFYAIDAARGAAKWTYEAKAAIQSSPCVIGETVFFGDSGGIFHAVDTLSGKSKWTFEAEGEIISSPNYADGKVLFGSYDGNLYGLSAGTGQLIFKTETQGRIHGTPGVAADQVLVAGCDEAFHLLRLSDGSSVGMVGMGSYSGAAAAIRGPRVIVGTFNNQVIAVDFNRRQIDWTYEHPERHFPFYGSAAVTDDLVVIGGRDKLVHAIETKTGKPRWTFPTRGKIDGSPVIVGQRVFIGSTDGNLYALDLAAGKEVWRFEAGSGFLATPAVAEGLLVIGTEDGVIYCFGEGNDVHH